MNCRPEFTGAENEQGREYVCVRCGKGKDAFTPDPPERWHNPRTCNALPFAWELGCWAELFLEAYSFVSMPRYIWLKYRLGFKPSCNCPKREAALNAAGELCRDGLAGSYCAAGGLAIR